MTKTAATHGTQDQNPSPPKRRRKGGRTDWPRPELYSKKNAGANARWSKVAEEYDRRKCTGLSIQYTHKDPSDTVRTIDSVCTVLTPKGRVPTAVMALTGLGDVDQAKFTEDETVVRWWREYLLKAASDTAQETKVVSLLLCFSHPSTPHPHTHSPARRHIPSPSAPLAHPSRALPSTREHRRKMWYTCTGGGQ